MSNQAQYSSWYGSLHISLFSTEEEIACVQAAGVEDIDDAVKAARQALRGPWSELSGTERGALMWKLADIAEKHMEAMAVIDTWNNGRSGV